MRVRAWVAWPEWVTIQFLYREGEGGLATEVCHDIIVCIVTRGVGLTSRHSVPGTAIRRPASCDIV